METSPLNCIQELAPRDRHYPWRVMVVCILLNQTHGRQVRPMIGRVWDLLPSPDKLLNLTNAERDQLKALLQPLGFVNKRFNILVRNAVDYVAGVRPHDCFGMGKYGQDSLDLFVYGKTHHVRPADKWLLPYFEWRKSGGPAVKWGEPEVSGQGA